MSKMFTTVLTRSFVGIIDKIEEFIKICPDDLWEKKVGTEYVWNHIYHSLACYPLVLTIPGVEMALPIKSAGSLDNKEDLSEPHSRELMEKFLVDIKDHAKKYFDRVDNDERLLDEISFFGYNMTRVEVMMLFSLHSGYHLGACDFFLRENGAKTVM